MAGRFQNKTATILAGQSLSDSIDCSAGAPVFVHMPTDWTPSRLTFQVSPDGTNYNDLFDSEAREVAVNIIAGTSVRLAPEWSPVTYLKVRSGGRAVPVPQAADRAIVITIDTNVEVTT